MTKIATIGTCSKSKLSLEGTNGPLGLNDDPQTIVVKYDSTIISI